MKKENKKKVKTAGLIVASAAVGTIVASKVMDEFFDNDAQPFEVDDMICVYGPPADYIPSDSLTDDEMNEELNGMFE